MPRMLKLIAAETLLVLAAQPSLSGWSLPSVSPQGERSRPMCKPLASRRTLVRPRARRA